MEDRDPRMLIFAMTIAELVVNPERQKDSLVGVKIKALKKSWALLEYYAKDGFSEQILDTIMEKKAKLILDATTIKDINEIAEPPKPQYDGNKWWSNKNSVPEEEMIWWSKASLRAPLSYEATMRYMELFKNFYGKSIHEIIG